MTTSVLVSVVATSSFLLLVTSVGEAKTHAHALPSPAMSAPFSLTPTAEEVLSLPRANREQVLAKLDPRVLRSDLRVLAFDSRRPFQLRWEALHSLARQSPSDSKGDLIRAIRSPEWFMRSAGLQALKEHFPNEFHHEAIRALNDSAMMVRSNAVQALESHLDLATRERLWAEFFHPRNMRGGKSLPIREQIIQLLGRNPHEGEVRFWQRAQAELQASKVSSVVAQVTEGALKKLALRVGAESHSALRQPAGPSISNESNAPQKTQIR